jgi:pimeloyl-ACP methyl ester carboxylesterase
MFWSAVIVLAEVIAGLAVLGYIGFLVSRYFFIPRYPDEIHFAQTTDDWRIAVIRYRPEAGVEPKDPVLLVHGIAANRYNFDLNDDVSLARYLASRGHDVWMVELRGRGFSTRPRLFSGLSYDWSFDEYAECDLPAAVDAVLRATGAPRLHLVGFSTGALACYAYLTGPQRAAAVSSLVSMAGPATFKRAGGYVSGRMMRNLRWMRHRFLMRILAPISGYWHLPLLQIIHNPENLNGDTQRRAMVNLIANFSHNELLQYSDWLTHDVFRSIDQRRDYRAEMPRITLPTLFLAGPRDLLAPPDAVKDAYDLVASTDKKFVICSKAQKFKVNYGHFDMLLGAYSPLEVYPLVGDWIEDHAIDLRGALPATEEESAVTVSGTTTTTVQ